MALFELWLSGDDCSWAPQGAVGRQESMWTVWCVFRFFMANRGADLAVLPGKFYHRHRRPRQVEYHAEESYHLSLRVETDRAKAVNRRKGGAAALRAMNQEATSAPESSTSVINLKSSTAVEQDDGDEDEDKPESKDDNPDSLNVVDIVGPPPESAAGVASPADTSSSEEPPLALGKSVASRANGSGVSRPALDSAQSQPPPSPPASSPPAQSQEQQQQSQSQQQGQGLPPQSQSPHQASPTLVAGTVASSSASSSTRPVSASKPTGRVGPSYFTRLFLLVLTFTLSFRIKPRARNG